MKRADYAIDRFEGEQAVLVPERESDPELLICRSRLPEGAKEGDLVTVRLLRSGAVRSIAPLARETAARREDVEALLAKLQNRSRDDL